MDDLLQEFIAETRETLESIAGEIVAWEADPGDRARLDGIFRFVHTVKGSCGFLDLPRLARLSHAAEDALAAVRAGERTPDRQLVNAVLAIIDRIGEIVEAIDAGTALDDTSEDLLIAALDGAPAPVAEPLAPVAGQVVSRLPTRSVRLSVDLLDRMMSGVSDMVLARNELARRVREGRDTALEATLDRLSLTLAELRETVSRTRMQTIDALFSPLPRVVRDTATALGKQVALTVDGGDVELDREMIELLRDPLVHMVRNALDHGIEAPAERRAAGKRETGRLSVAARQSGNRIIVEIADDGRGVDTARIVAKVAAADPSRAAELAAMDERARLDLIFEPGLSSRDEVTALSGRGVGMDVVRANVAQIGGRISLANRPGRGLIVSIEVPLTLAILATVVVEAGGECFALPRQAIDEIVSAHADVVRIDRLGDAQLATVRDRRLPLVSLARVIGVEAAAPAMLMIVDVPGGSFALAVDAVADIQELVIKPAAPAVMAAGIYAGQALPDSGLPLLLLDCAGLARAAGLVFAPAAIAADDEAPPAPTGERPRALLFEDLDGRRRAIALAAVDRIETVPAAALHQAGERAWVTIDDTLVPLVALRADLTDQAAVLLRLHDDRGAIAYRIAAAHDIAVLPDTIAPTGSDGPVCGVALIEGEPVELLDPSWLLDRGLGAGTGAGAPVCLLAGAQSAWMDAVLRPLVAAAGYRVTTRLSDGERPAITLTLDDAPLPAGAGEVIRLRRDGGDGIAWHDRDAISSALSRGVGR